MQRLVDARLLNAFFRSCLARHTWRFPFKHIKLLAIVFSKQSLKENL
jgi:hypothetical protein